MTAAYCAVVRFHRAELQAASGENLSVGIKHFLVRCIHAVHIFIKGVQILHDKFATAHKPKSRTNFVAIFVLDLVEQKRQLFV